MIFPRCSHHRCDTQREKRLLQRAEVPRPEEQPVDAPHRPRLEMSDDRDSSAYGVEPDVFVPDAIETAGAQLAALRAHVEEAEDAIQRLPFDAEATNDPSVVSALDALENALGVEPNEALHASPARRSQGPVEDAQRVARLDRARQKETDALAERQRIAHSTPPDTCDTESSASPTLAAKLRAEALSDVKKQIADNRRAYEKEQAWTPEHTWFNVPARLRERRAHDLRLAAIQTSYGTLRSHASMLQSANDTNDPANLRRIIDARVSIGLPPSTPAAEFSSDFERARWQSVTPTTAALSSIEGGTQRAGSTQRSPEQRRRNAEARTVEIPEGMGEVTQPEQDIMLRSAGWQPVEGAEKTYELQGMQLAYQPSSDSYVVREGDGPWTTATRAQYGPSSERSTRLESLARQLQTVHDTARSGFTAELRRLPEPIATMASMQADVLLRQAGFRYDKSHQAYRNAAREEMRLSTGVWTTSENASAATIALAARLTKDLTNARIGRSAIRPAIAAQLRLSIINEHPTWRERGNGSIITDYGAELRFMQPYGWCMRDANRGRWHMANESDGPGATIALITRLNEVTSEALKKEEDLA